MATRTCKKCNRPMADVGVAAHCPACLFSLCLDVQSWGDYELLCLVGQGGMGQVFKARERVPPFRKLVALKRIRPGTFSTSALKRFMVEAESSANLHHPNIITIYHYGEYDGEPFYSMTYIDGCTLKEYRQQPAIANGLSSESDPKIAKEILRKFATIIKKVALAVDYAHRHGVLHCDLKPANIMIDSDGDPHLADFGLAKYFRTDLIQETSTTDLRYDSENRPVWPEDSRSGSLTGTDSLIAGSLHYMSPEQAILKPSDSDAVHPPQAKDADSPKRPHRTRNLTVATDIYSLGAVLYFVLTGHPPLRGGASNISEFYDYLVRIHKEPPVPPSSLNPGLDRDLEAICLKCLKKKPEDRYANASVLAADLDNWLNNKPVDAYPVGRLGRMWRWCLREPLLVGLTVTLIIALSLSTCLSLYILSHERKRLADAEDMQKQIETILTERIKREWEGPKASVTITANERFRFLKQSFDASRVIPIKIATHTDTSHANIEKHIEDHSPLLNYIEKRPEHKLFNISHIIFKDHLSAANAVISNAVDVAYLCCEAYIRVLESDPNACPIAKPLFVRDYSNTGVIFVNENSPIVEIIPEIRGSHLILSPPSVFSAHAAAKEYFYDLGLAATDFRCNTENYAATIIGKVLQDTNNIVIGATHYTSVVDAIREASFKNNSTGLRVLRIIPPVKSPERLWVASSNFRKSQHDLFLSMQKGLFTAPSRTTWNIHTKLIGFTNSTLEDITAARAVVEKAQKFDAKK